MNAPINALCATCTQPCKQPAEVQVMSCAHYEKAKP